MHKDDIPVLAFIAVMSITLIAVLIGVGVMAYKNTESKAVTITTNNSTTLDPLEFKGLFISSQTGCEYLFTQDGAVYPNLTESNEHKGCKNEH